MRVAIFGATSQIAKDLVLSFSRQTTHDLVLYARRLEAVSKWLVYNDLQSRYAAFSLDKFDKTEYFDAILNFIGSGDPAQTAALGATIFDITYHFDQIILDYLQQHPTCKYIFMSSGAAFGDDFSTPVDESSRAIVPLNNLKSHDWYSIAKLYAEARHRSHSELPIVDVRIFNYFSHTLNLSTRFFIADILRAIKSGEILHVSADNIVRDYIGPNDFFRVISSVLNADNTNDVIDCYTQAPVDKMTLLSQMAKNFGLVFRVNAAASIINSTGLKVNYYSLNKSAKKFGYTPHSNSLSTVLDESRRVL